MTGAGALRASIGRCVAEVVAPLDLDDRLGLSSAAIGLLFAAGRAVGGPARQARPGPRRARDHGALSAPARRPARVARTAIALGTYGVGFSLCFAAAVPMLDESFDEAQRGLAYGVQNVLYAGGYALGPILGGLLLDVASAKVVYVGTAAAVAGATIALLVGDRSKTATERM